MTITTWPTLDRPREKLLSQGAKYLSDAELLAILLQTGTQGKTALDIARELLTESGGLKKLGYAPAHHFYQKRGLGKAKFAMLQAALELGKRHCEEPLLAGQKLGNSEITKRCIADRLKDYAHEVFSCLFLDTQNRIIAFEELFHGTLTESNVYPREVVKRALAHNAAKVILAHNHPSGNPNPSSADRDITRTLQNALELVDIKVVDHIIVAPPEVLSFAETGLIIN